MSPHRLAIATYDDIPELTDEDRILSRALAPLGIECIPWVWTRSRPDAIDAVFVRSCWDYHHAYDAFVAWIDGLERTATPLANAPETIRWNLCKGYLLELEKRDVAIPETRLVRAGDDATPVIAAMRPGDLVVKPAVSMSGWETHRFAADDRAGATACVERLANGRLGSTRSGAGRDVLVQAYRSEIADGEVSIVYFGGEPSHAIRKRPAAGEFRIQSEYGGTREPIEAEPAWIDAASRALSCVPGEALVARVDGVIVDGAFVLMELEAIDPMVFLEWAPPRASAMFAEAVASWLARS